jgi:hypothetical protein
MAAESKLERWFGRMVAAAGGVSRKHTSPGRRGGVDRIVGFPGGVFCLVEFKAPGKKPTALQEREHAEWRARGFVVEVIDNDVSASVLVSRLSHMSASRGRQA